MDQSKNLEQFRKYLEEEFTSKGIIPPPAGSPEEKELYERWQAGADRLKAMDL